MKNPTLQLMAVKAAGTNTEAYWLCWRYNHQLYSRRYADRSALEADLALMDSDFILWSYNNISMELRPGYLTPGAPAIPPSDTVIKVFSFSRPPSIPNIAILANLAMVTGYNGTQTFVYDPDAGPGTFINQYYNQ